MGWDGMGWLGGWVVVCLSACLPTCLLTLPYLLDIPTVLSCGWLAGFLFRASPVPLSRVCAISVGNGVVAGEWDEGWG